MRFAFIGLVIITAGFVVSGFDASVSFRTSLNETNHTYTDALLVKNEAYPNGSPATVSIQNTLLYTNISNNTTTTFNLSLNKYTYRGTSSFNITPNVKQVCAEVHAFNRTDPTVSNNKACTVLQKNTTDNVSTNKTNATNVTTDDPIDDTKDVEEKPSNNVSCMSLLDAPSTVKEGETIEFFVNASLTPVTYWATDTTGKRVKDAYTTDNPGIKHFTPDETSWVAFHASTETCEETATTGVQAVQMEPFVRIDDVDVEESLISVSATRHSSTASAVTISVEQNGDVSETASINLPSGKTSFSANIPVTDISAGISSVVVEQEGRSDSFRFNMKEKALLDRYPRLIRSVYDRKKYYGPTTLYVSFEEHVTGYVVTTVGDRRQRTSLNASSAEVTVIPDGLNDVVGVAVENRLGEIIDTSYHVLNLTARTNQSERQVDREDEQNKTDPSPVSRDASLDKTRRVEASPATTEQRRFRPFIGGTLLFVGFGYGLYRFSATKGI